MKKIRSIIPFITVFVLLIGSVFTAKLIHSKSGDVCPVNTGIDQNGEIHTMRVFKSISSVMVIDMENHSKKRKIPQTEYSYDPKTTKLTIQTPLPFEKSVIHIEGKAFQPETFCLYDFSGSSDSLLVILDGREAIENYEYTFDSEKRTLTFRSDIHPESDGLYHIMYKTENDSMHSFGNWGKKDSDKLAELQWKWLNKTQGAPMFVMKDRSSLSNAKLSKETGFKIHLPKGNATFISEQMEGNEKVISVTRWFDKAGLTVECKARPFLTNDETKYAEAMEIVQFGKTSASRQNIIGVQQESDGSQTDVPLVVYEWHKDGTYYSMTVTPDKVSEAEKLLSDL